MPSVIDFNGWKEIKDNPLSCVGVYPYMGKDLPGAPDPAKVYYVYRPAEELADPECIESFKLLPWIDEHTMLGEDFTQPELKGIQGVIGEDVYFRDGKLLGNIKMFSGLLKRLIESGKRELSCGYRCMYEAACGVFEGQHYDYIQRKIRGNHLALVDEGRMGPDVAVLDHLDAAFTFTLDSKGLIDMADEENTPGEGSEPTDESKTGEMTLAELSTLVQTIAPQVQELVAALAKLTNPAPTEETVAVDEDNSDDDDKKDKSAAMDSQIKKLQSQVATLKAEGVKSTLGELSRRNALYSQLSQHVGAFDHVLMTTDEIAQYGVKKLGINCTAGAEHATLTGYLHNRTVFTGNKPTVAQDGKPKGSAVTAYLNKGSAV